MSYHALVFFDAFKKMSVSMNGNTEYKKSAVTTHLRGESLYMNRSMLQSTDFTTTSINDCASSDCLFFGDISNPSTTVSQNNLISNIFLSSYFKISFDVYLVGNSYNPDGKNILFYNIIDITDGTKSILKISLSTSNYNSRIDFNQVSLTSSGPRFDNSDWSTYVVTVDVNKVVGTSSLNNKWMTTTSINTQGIISTTNSYFLYASNGQDITAGGSIRNIKVSNLYPNPSVRPTYTPSYAPSIIFLSNFPTFSPTSIQSSCLPTAIPTNTPIANPTNFPSVIASTVPTNFPNQIPSISPSRLPTREPVIVQTSAPAISPTTSPSCRPTSQPQSTPTSIPTTTPTSSLSSVAKATSIPSSSPSSEPSASPTSSPSSIPTSTPTSSPSSEPSASPTSSPSFIPTSAPTSSPS
eukprot:gene17572-24392_t